MSSKSNEKNTENRGKVRDDEPQYKLRVKLRKTLNFLFNQDGLAKREIRHEKEDEVAVDDLLASEHFSKQFTAEDFDNAVAKDSYDILLKEEPHFLLVTSNGRKVVKYYKEPLEYKENPNAIDQINDGANVSLSREPVAVEKVINEEKPGKHEEKEEKKQGSESTTGGNKKKNKNKKKKAGTGESQGGTNKNQSKMEDEESPVPNVPVVKEASASAESETKSETVSSSNGKHQSDATDSNTTICPTRETIDESRSPTSASESKDEVLVDSENSENNYDEGFSPAVDKKGSKKSSKKKGKQSESSGIKNSGNELKQNKDGKQATESLGKAGKQTEKSSAGKQTKPQKANESKQKNSDKQTKSENSQKKPTNDVNNAALSSDEEKTSTSPEGPPKKKQKPEDRPKKIINTFKYLFGEKNGLKEKEITVGDDGFVQLKAIIEVYQAQYNWNEKELTDALDNSEDYEFKHDDTHGLLVKAVEKKSQAVDQPLAMEEHGNGDSWQTSGRPKEGQEDRKQRPPQNYSAASRPPGFGALAPDKLRSTLFWILGKDGAAKNSIQFQPGKRLYVDEIIDRIPSLGVSASEIKAAVESDPRKQFVIEESKGQLTIRLQENRPPRDRNTDFPGKGDFHLSKTMSFVLRHGAERLQLAIQPDGFMFVDELLNHRDLRSYNEEDVKRVVRDNDKQRFLIAEDPQTGRLKVRANQGHTFVVPDLELKPITSADDTPTVVHGTYHASWKIIQKEGLSRMSRNHIHFAAGEPGSDGVISGMRNSCDILIFIDLQTALNDGVKFFRSANNVILSPGDDKGIVAPKYFKSVVQRSPRMKLL